MNLSGTNFSELGRTYRITPIQHPTLSAAFQGAYLHRLPIAPPPIFQFDCWDADGQITIPYDELPFLVCHLTLQTPTGEDASLVRSPEGEVVSMLYGTLVAAPAEMLDVEGGRGIYFAFPDVSVRFVGTFRLTASVMRITGGQPLDTCTTNTFDAVDNADYIAPPVTDLTQHFDSQGAVRFGLPRGDW